MLMDGFNESAFAGDAGFLLSDWKSDGTFRIPMTSIIVAIFWCRMSFIYSFNDLTSL